MIFPFSEYFLLQLDLIECTQYGRKADLGEGFRAKALLCRRDIDTYSRNSVILNEEGSYIHPIDKRFARGKDLFFLPAGEGDGLLQCEALRKCRGGRKVTFLVVSNKFRTIKES